MDSSQLVLLVLVEILFIAILLVVALKRLNIRFRNIEITQQSGIEYLRRVDKAVNNVPDGELPLIERVAKLEVVSDEIRGRLEVIEEKIDRIASVVGISQRSQ